MNKKNSIKRIFSRAFFEKNPILVQAIGLAPIVAVAYSLKAAVVLGFMTVLLVLPIEIFTSAVLKKLPAFLRAGLYMLCGILALIPIIMLFQKILPNILVSFGVYLPLISVNSLIIYRSEGFAVKNSVLYSFFDALAYSGANLVTMCVIGAVREILGSASIFGVKIPVLNPSAAFLLPFGGFIVLGFAAAFLQKLILRHDGSEKPALYSQQQSDDFTYDNAESNEKSAQSSQSEQGGEASDR